VRITVEDNAGGIPADLRERLFEPFVTGRPKGIGLGLTMALRAVAEQGGQLSWEAIDQGSRFAITLPLGEPP
jgi:nitrogen-specific signal transduction histidine kinase